MITVEMRVVKWTGCGTGMEPAAHIFSEEAVVQFRPYCFSNS